MITEIHDARSDSDSIALDIAPDGIELTTLTPNDASPSENDVETVLEEAVRGLCAICYDEEGLLTHPKTDTCAHKFCEDCFLAYEKYGRVKRRTRNGRVLCCPLCRTPYPSDRSVALPGIDHSQAMQRIQRVDIFSAQNVREFARRHRLKLLGFTACCIAFQAIIWNVLPSSDDWIYFTNTTSTSH